MPDNLDELIRTGQIDITTRETVENERDKAQRAAEPGAYALTYEEHLDVLQTGNIVDTVLAKSGAVLDSTFDGQTLSQDIISEIKEELKRHGLDPDQLHALASRVLLGNWYILLLSQYYSPHKGGKHGLFLVASVDGKIKNGILSAEDFPSVYDGSTHAEQRKALNLPSDAALLHSEEHRILSFILEISNGGNIRGQMSIFPEEEAQQRLIAEVISALPENFSSIRQGTATNTLTKIRPTKRNTTIDVITGAATIKQGEMTVTFPSFETVSGLKTSTYKLLDAITEVFTAAGSANPVVRLDLKEYMEKCGLKDRKEARKQAVSDLETLRTAAISFMGKRRGADTGYYKMNISDGVGISSRGVMTFTFSGQFFNLIRDYPKMPYPNLLYRLNGKKNPNSYYLLRKIAEHKHMNVGKRNEDTISVKTLLSAAAFIPSYSTVSKGDRHYDTRIIAPFERDMDALSEALKWEYCHANHAPLTDKELATLDYDTFSKLLVHIIWEQYPNQTARLERRAERLKAAQNKQPRKKGKAEGKGG